MCAWDRGAQQVEPTSVGVVNAVESMQAVPCSKDDDCGCAALSHLSQSWHARNFSLRYHTIPSRHSASHMKQTTFLASSIALLSLYGCATSLEPAAERIRMVSAAEKAACESLGLIAADQQLGPYKASNSMNKMLNEAARRGANGVFLVSQGKSGIDGVAVTAEALRCK